jgi:hypothetical protein
MKTKQITLQNIVAMICAGLLMALLFLSFVSCRKTGSLSSTEDITNIANRLNGMIVTGSISTISGEDGLGLLSDNGKTFFALERIPLHGITDPGSIKHAQLVYSAFGIIIRDMDTLKSWYYIQNDAESKKQFAALPVSTGNILISGIAGTIKINISTNS